MRLGKLLNELDGFYEHKTISMKDGHVLPPYFHSYRGDYCILAIDYAVKSDEEFTVREFKNVLHKALGKGTMQGYKGGEYRIHNDTDVVIAQYGDSGGFFIGEFIEREDDVYMATGEID